MKFGKTYTEYVASEVQRVYPQSSYVRFKRLKKLLKDCPQQEESICGEPSLLETRRSSAEAALVLEIDAASASNVEFGISPGSYMGESWTTCSVCDRRFFPTLMEEVEAVVRFFNARAQELLQLHLASGLRKYFLRFKNGMATSDASMLQQGKTLVCYGFMNALAIRKILKKYDKVHRSVAGRAFKIQLQAMRAELLQSPLLLELGALSENLKDSQCAKSLCQKPESSPPNFNLHIISCVLSEDVKIDVDLTCAICLETLFNPVALGCGHIFCNTCACSAASVPVVRGLRAASSHAKCPLCRQVGVYIHTLPLAEVWTLICNRYKDCYEERLRRERALLVQQTREYWDKQLQDLVGF